MAAFQINYYALLFVAFMLVSLGILVRWRKQFAIPSLYISRLKAFQGLEKSWKQKNIVLPYLLKLAAFGCWLMAFSDPHIQQNKRAVDADPTEGIALYLLVDQSGSMGQMTSTGAAKAVRSGMTKIDFLKKITGDFIEGNSIGNLAGRPNDMIGLIAFARTAHILVPLTLDHKAVLDALSNLKVVDDKTQDGTAMGYAIFKAVNVLKAVNHYAEVSGNTRPAYEIRNSAIVLITDGFQSPNPLDEHSRLRNIGLAEAADYAKKNHVKLFVINVEPGFARSEFVPHRNLMERITQLTGGKFYLVSDTVHLQPVYEALSSMVKSYLNEPSAEEWDLNQGGRMHCAHNLSTPFSSLLG